MTAAERRTRPAITARDGERRKVPSRRHLLALLFAPLVLSLLCLLPTRCARDEPPSPAPRPSRRPLRVARYYWPGQFWIDIAAEKGWFAAEGLNVVVVDTSADYYTSLQGTAEGKIDVNIFYVFDLLKRNAEGADLVGFLSADSDNGASGIVLKPGIDRFSALREKKVAVEIGTFYEYLLSLALAAEGLTLSDVARLDSKGEQAVKAYRRPEVGAVVTWEPRVGELVARGATRVFDTGDVPGAGAMVFAARRDVVRDRPEDVAALTRVWWKTTRFIRRDPQAAWRIVARLNGKSPGEVEAFASQDSLRDRRENVTAFVYGPGFESLHGLGQSVNRYLLEQGIVDRAVDTTTALDGRFVRALPEEEPAG